MKELNFEQMECINGGGWLSDAWNWVKDAAGNVWDWIVDSLFNYFGTKVNDYLWYLHDATNYW